MERIFRVPLDILLIGGLHFGIRDLDAADLLLQFPFTERGDKLDLHFPAGVRILVESRSFRALDGGQAVHHLLEQLLRGGHELAVAPAPRNFGEKILGQDLFTSHHGERLRPARRGHGFLSAAGEQQDA